MAFVAGHARDRSEARSEAWSLLAVFDEVGTYFTSSASVPALPPILHMIAAPVPEPRVPRLMHSFLDLRGALPVPSDA
jgi:hypothetical protein